MLSYLSCLHECRSGTSRLPSVLFMQQQVSHGVWDLGLGCGGENLSLTLALGIERLKNLFGDVNGSCPNSRAPRTTHCCPLPIGTLLPPPTPTSASWAWVVTEWSSLPSWPHPG